MEAAMFFTVAQSEQTKHLLSFYCKQAGLQTMLDLVGNYKV